MSKWGSLLQGAVANLESRLDTILAEDKESAASRSSKSNSAAKTAQPQNKSGLLRTPSIKKDKAASIETPPGTSVDGDRSRLAHLRTPSQAPSRTASISPAGSQPPSTRDPVKEDKLQSEDESRQNDGGDPTSDTMEAQERLNSLPTEEVAAPYDENTMTSLELHAQVRPPIDSIVTDSSDNNSNDITYNESRDLVSQLKKEKEQAEIQLQEESHAYLERIDALQAKLQYLTKEAAQTAQNNVSEATKDSPEQKLAAKDEQIALLMAEGQKLSKLEVSQAGVIRKLRAKATEESKEVIQLKQRLKRTEQIQEDMSQKLQRAEVDLKNSASRNVRLAQLEKEVQSLRIEVKSKQAAIEETKRQLEQERRQKEELRQVLHTTNQSLVGEQKVTQTLRDDLEAIRIELKETLEKAKASSRNFEADMQREREKHQGTESSLRGEIQALEARVEALRERSEEASSGMKDDTQAKLMRHVETLQTQYALASENWQGIENSLQSRITALETEKDEALRHEVETRRKARDSSNAVRRLHDELESTTRKSKVLEQEVLEQRGTVDKLQSRAKEFETDLRNAREAFQREKQAWEASLAARIEEEKTKWHQEQPRWTGAESPVAPSEFPVPPPFSRKASTFERPTFAMRRNMSGRFAPPELGVHSIETRALSRRSSAMRLHSADWAPPTSVWENGHPHAVSSPMPPQTPSIHTIDQDDMFEGSSSPHRTVNDMISVSTVAAGPSVQLVERMSATVRRLESEKAASKDELARLLTQRDEARQEIVSLMREVQEKRDAEDQARKHQAGLTDVTKRYQTTLEMLGEKSEQVEELQADVADLKKMYRELVDSTMK